MKMPEEVAKRIRYIKEFAEKMGYTTYEESFTGCENERPMYWIYLNERSDCEGNPYYWSWYKDTWEEYEK